MKLSDIPPCPDCGETRLEAVEERCTYWTLVEGHDGEAALGPHLTIPDGDIRAIRYVCCEPLPRHIERALLTQFGEFFPTANWNFHDAIPHPDTFDDGAAKLPASTVALDVIDRYIEAFGPEGDASGVFKPDVANAIWHELRDLRADVLMTISQHAGEAEG